MIVFNNLSQGIAVIRVCSIYTLQCSDPAVHIGHVQSVDVVITVFQHGGVVFEGVGQGIINAIRRRVRSRGVIALDGFSRPTASCCDAEGIVGIGRHMGAVSAFLGPLGQGNGSGNAVFDLALHRGVDDLRRESPVVLGNTCKGALFFLGRRCLVSVNSCEKRRPNGLLQRIGVGGVR